MKYFVAAILLSFAFQSLIEQASAQDIPQPSSLVCKGIKRGRVSSYHANLKFKQSDIGYSVSGNLERKTNSNGKLLSSYRVKGTWEFLKAVMGVAIAKAVNGKVEYKGIVALAGGFVHPDIDEDEGDYWILAFYRERSDRPWLKLKCELTKVVYPPPLPTVTPVPVPVADIYVFLITNAGDTLFVGSEPELAGKALCLIQGAGTDCATKVIYRALVGPFATDEEALRNGICANITALHYNKLVPWGPWARWGTGDLWYRLFEPSAEAALQYCPNLPIQ